MLRVKLIRFLLIVIICVNHLNSALIQMISLRAEDEETVEFFDLSIFYELSRGHEQQWSSFSSQPLVFGHVGKTLVLALLFSFSSLKLTGQEVEMEKQEQSVLASACCSYQLPFQLFLDRVG